MMILHDIRRNRYRLAEAIRQITDLFENDTPNRRLQIIGRLHIWRLISDEHHKHLMENIDGDMDIDTFISELKTTKIGHGIDFLPTSTKNLNERIQNIGKLLEFDESNAEQLRRELSTILEELWQRKAISEKEYKDKLSKIDL